MFPAVRQQAAAAMWLLGSQKGMDDLIGWTLSRFPDDQMMGLLGLAEPRNRSIIQHVRNGLTTDWPDVNLTAARAMGMLGSDEGYGIAQEGAKSSDPRQRIAAALAFGAIGRSDAQDLLKSLLHDSDPNVRVAAAGAILQLKFNSAVR
jgi:HEAT repeat protein